MSRNRLFVPALLALCSLCSLAKGEDQQEFRIETKIYSGSGRVPVSQNTTLFRGGYVYDYLSNPQQIAVLDQPHGRFILLDPIRKLRAEVKMDDVQKWADVCKPMSAKSASSFTRFAADPNFEVDLADDGKLSLKSDHITYTLKTMPAISPQAALQFQRFSDWYARFNAMTTPGATPPFARMAVNAELANRGLLPTEVHVTTHNSLGKSTNLRSEHHITWRLLQRDVTRIAETDNQLATFKPVDFGEFNEPAVSKR